MRAMVLALLVSGCVVVPDPAATPTGDGTQLPPPGYGTLRQDDITVTFRSGDLQIKVTPLAESVIRVAAPDTERRLRGLAESRAPEATSSAGAGASMFLVSFYSESPDVAFVPEELQFLSRSVRIRAAAILPVTPSWGQRRLRQRETEMAVYVFPGSIDLESDLAAVYGLEENWAWNAILPRVQAERARARARAGVGR